MLGDDLACCGGAVHAIHGQIHDNDVRIESVGELHGFGSIGSFTDHIDVGRGAEHRPEACTDDGVIVGENYANGGCAHVSAPRGSSEDESCKGIDATTDVPPPGLVVIRNSPSTRATRSRIVNSPIPVCSRCLEARSKPRPSSAISRITERAPVSRRISMFPGAACRRAFCTASCATRYNTDLTGAESASSLPSVASTSTTMAPA